MARQMTKALAFLWVICGSTFIEEKSFKTTNIDDVVCTIQILDGRQAQIYRWILSKADYKAGRVQASARLRLPARPRYALTSGVCVWALVPCGCRNSGCSVRVGGGDVADSYQHLLRLGWGVYDKLARVRLVAGEKRLSVLPLTKKGKLDGKAQESRSISERPPGAIFDESGSGKPLSLGLTSSKSGKGYVVATLKNRTGFFATNSLLSSQDDFFESERRVKASTQYLAYLANSTEATRISKSATTSIVDFQLPAVSREHIKDSLMSSHLGLKANSSAAHPRDQISPTKVTGSRERRPTRTSNYPGRWPTSQLTFRDTSRLENSAQTIVKIGHEKGASDSVVPSNLTNFLPEVFPSKTPSGSDFDGRSNTGGIGKPSIIEQEKVPADIRYFLQTALLDFYRRRKKSETKIFAQPTSSSRVTFHATTGSAPTVQKGSRVAFSISSTISPDRGDSESESDRYDEKPTETMTQTMIKGDVIVPKDIGCQPEDCDGENEMEKVEAGAKILENPTSISRNVPRAILHSSASIWKDDFATTFAVIVASISLSVALVLVALTLSMWAFSRNFKGHKKALVEVELSTLLGGQNKAQVDAKPDVTPCLRPILNKNHSQ